MKRYLFACSFHNPKSCRRWSVERRTRADSNSLRFLDKHDVWAMTQSYGSLVSEICHSHTDQPSLRDYKALARFSRDWKSGATFIRRSATGRREPAARDSRPPSAKRLSTRSVSSYERSFHVGRTISLRARLGRGSVFIKSTPPPLKRGANRPTGGKGFPGEWVREGIRAPADPTEPEMVR